MHQLCPGQGSEERRDGNSERRVKEEISRLGEASRDNELVVLGAQLLIREQNRKRPFFSRMDFVVRRYFPVEFLKVVKAWGHATMRCK